MNLIKDALLKYENLQRYKELSISANFQTSQVYYRKTFKPFGDKPLLIEDFFLERMSLWIKNY